MIYIKEFDGHSDYNSFINGEDFVKPNVSLCDNENELHYNRFEIDYSTHYLTTKALENGTISFNILENMDTDAITSISYSTDNGETWTTTQNQNSKAEKLQITVNVNEGDSVLWKGIAENTGIGGHSGSFFSSTAHFNVEGNIASMTYGDEFINVDETETSKQYIGLFSDASQTLPTLLVSAKNLSLASDTLCYGAYGSMFRGCSTLVVAPKLPATNLGGNCYHSMFEGCTSLKNAPELPATIIGRDNVETTGMSAYGDMFKGCTSLKKAPALPATTLAEWCYSGMFSGCTSLRYAPELPATTLLTGCYNNMFNGCTSLRKAPVLPATTLVSDCYGLMFSNCSSLNYIKAMFTTEPSGDYTFIWVMGVKENGTFVKNSSASWDVTGEEGIPEGWTVETAAE